MEKCKERAHSWGQKETAEEDARDSDKDFNEESYLPV